MQFNWENIGIKTRVEKNAIYFFDPIRKRYIKSTPEEEVRQWFIHVLVTELGYPQNCIAVEREIKYHSRRKRFDILIYKESTPVMLIECKAPEIALSQKVFDQLSTYNFELKVPYLVITNGKNHISCQLDLTKKTFHFLKNLPPYKSLFV